MTEALKILALQGRAKWQTWPCAFGSAFSVPVAQGSFLLLEQIIFNPFVSTTSENNTAAALSGSVCGLSIVEQGGANELMYNFRSPAIFGTDRAGNPVMNNPGVPVVIPTFKLFRKTMCVDLALWPDVKDIVDGAGPFGNESQERQNPTGYGTDSPLAVATYGGVNYYPNIPLRPQLGVVPSGTNFQYARPVFKSTGLVYRPSQVSALNSRQNTQPFINLGFWVVTGDPETLFNEKK